MSWVEITRKRAVDAQIKADALGETARQLVDEFEELDRLDLAKGQTSIRWGFAKGSQQVQRRLQEQAARASDDARRAFESYEQALASEAAMPAAWRAS